MRTRVYLDRLVLGGLPLPGESGGAAAAAFADELVRLLQRRPPAVPRANRSQIDRLAVDVSLPDPGDARITGRNIAHAMHEAISR
ncbi:MAG: hypothetical protein AUI36_13125 [Cyanobacteria bacterium 13_1_40CM_2_61_4]|nr:MAG: hypothetical protein AUI36_13125 [Cyanobacteria bacterium 13_1_40CM_2_61_4]